MWRSDEIATLQPEVRGFDPRRALDGGPRRACCLPRRSPRMRGGCSAERARSWWSLAAGQLDAGRTRFRCRPALPCGAAAIDLAGMARALAVKASPPGHAMTSPQFRHAKNRLDCGARPITFRAGIDPETPAAPRSPQHAPESQRREDARDKRRRSGNRLRRLGIEMLHRFGAAAIGSRRGLRMTRGGQRRSRGCGQGVAASRQDH